MHSMGILSLGYRGRSVRAPVRRTPVRLLAVDMEEEAAVDWSSSCFRNGTVVMKPASIMQSYR